jgi:phosphatidylglycerophosphate synthase
MKWYSAYKHSLKMLEVEEIVDLIFYRPIAFLLVKMIYNTRITPDHLTLGAIIMGLTGGFLYAFGMRQTSIAGAIFYILFIVFDCSDGQLARLKNNGTKIGRLLDGIADYIVMTAIYIGLAIGTSEKTGHHSNMLILLALSGVGITCQALLVDYYRTRFLDTVLNRNNTFSQGVQEYRTEYVKLKFQKGKWLERNIILIYLFYSKLQRNLIGKRKSKLNLSVTHEEYYAKNRVMIRLWLIMGPSAIRTALIICTLFSRLDIYFWLTIVAFNILAVVLWLIQHRIDKTYKVVEKQQQAEKSLISKTSGIQLSK